MINISIGCPCLSVDPRGSAQMTCWDAIAVVPGFPSAPQLESITCTGVEHTLFMKDDLPTLG